MSKRIEGRWAITFNYPTQEFIESNEAQHGNDWRLVKLRLAGNTAWVMYWGISKEGLILHLRSVYSNCVTETITDSDIVKFDLARYNRLD